MAIASQDRIMSLDVSPMDFVMAMADNNPGAIQVIVAWMGSSPMAIIEMLMLDSKRLYGHRIWELFKVCGENLDRFKYHVAVELPNQETGELSVTGPFSPRLGDNEFWAKRRFGRPGSFWALENPPTETAYTFPIN